VIPCGGHDFPLTGAEGRKGQEPDAL